MAAGRTYLEHYVSGEYEQVWDELVALGVAVRQEPLHADALAVARETMRLPQVDIARRRDRSLVQVVLMCLVVSDEE